MALLIEISSFIYGISSFIFMDLGVWLSSVSKLQSESESFCQLLLYKNCFLEEYEYEKAKGEDIVNLDFCLLFYFVVSTAIDRISKSGSRWEYAVRYSFYFAMHFYNTFLSSSWLSLV